MSPGVAGARPRRWRTATPIASSWRRRAALVAMAVVAVVVLAGCRVDARVVVDVSGDGSGEVRADVVLDRSAVEAIGDVATKVVVADLVAAGWTVDPPMPGDGGSVRLQARHRFTTPAAAAQLVDDLGGGSGPLQGFEVIQQRSFAKTTTELRGTVDLERGLASFSDPDLQEALGGQPFGLSDEELERRLGGPADQVVGMEVAVRLPGQVTAVGATEDAGLRIWTAAMGQRTTLEATSVQWNVRNLAAAAVAASAALGLFSALALRRRNARRGAFVGLSYRS